MSMQPNRNETTAKLSYVFGATALGVATAVPGAVVAPAVMEQVKVTEAISAGSPTRYVDEKLLDAKLALTEAQTESKFERLLGRLDVIAERIGNVASDVGELKASVDRVESKTTNTRIIIVTTVIGAALTIVGLTYGIIGYGHQVADSISSAFAAGQSNER